MDEIHIEVGMKVYAIPYGNARLRQHKPFCVEGTVTKVGRKYAYINFGYYTAKWSIKKEDRENQDVRPGCAVADDNAYYRLFPSKEACEEFIAAMDDVNTISNFIRRWNNEALVDKLTPAGVKTIRGLLEYLSREDADPRFLNALTNAGDKSPGRKEGNMKFSWKDNPEIGCYDLSLIDDDGKELETMWISDHTAPRCVEFDRMNRDYREYAYEVGYCHGYSMRQGFDKDEGGDDHYGFRGTPKHSVEDIKRWCENYIAQLYLRDYKRALETLEEKRCRAEWFEANGFKLE